MLAILATAFATATAHAVELRPGDILLTDSRRDTVLRVDPESGERVRISGGNLGTGTGLQYPLGMSLLPDGRILLADQNQRALVAIDPVSGDRTPFSAKNIGLGLKLRSPKNLDFHSSGYFAVGDAGLDAVVRVDLQGHRELLTPTIVRGTPSLKNPIGIRFDAEGFLFVIDNNRRALFRVDPADGSRVVVSSPEIGAGPMWLNPAAISVEATGHVVAADRDFGVWRVDPASGERSVVSSNDRGEGPDWIQPFSIGVESDGQLLVVDRDQFAVLRVDPETGDRAILSSPDLGGGEELLRPRHIIVVPGVRARPLGLAVRIGIGAGVAGALAALLGLAVRQRRRVSADAA
jgi:sugar lactone lactonase YvrE